MPSALAVLRLIINSTLVACSNVLFGSISLTLGKRVTLVAIQVAAAATKALGVRVVRVHENPDDPAGVFTLSVEPSESPAMPARKTDALLLMFTSATTGAPKLVPLRGANLRAMASQDVKAFQLTAEDRLLNVAPLFHILGLAIVMTQLHCGGTVMITQGFHPKTFLTWLDEFRPTWFSSSSPMNHAFLRLGKEHRDFFRSLPLRIIRAMGETPEYEVLVALEGDRRASRPYQELYDAIEKYGSIVIEATY